jgi:hypothetical protein|tara:strand:- start:67 stop:948 length:882 start_codon:yes stop_codon:yes gene_type:complete
MPELTEVETPKNAGFVQNKSTLTANRKRIEQDEAELKSLMEARTESPTEEESTEKKEADTEAKEETLSAEERTYKKRYSDLRKHLNKQSEEIKELKAQMEEAAKGQLLPPKSDEEIDAWTKKYPEIASIVETKAAKIAEEKFAKADKRLQEIDQLNAETQRTKSENAIRKIHPDFDELRESDDFHNWAGEQPKWVQDALYENQDDPRSVVRVIDLFKVDNGMDIKSKKRTTKEAASQVKTKRTTKIDGEGVAGQILESQVQKMSAREYEARSEDIMKAIQAGNFVYDISGGAR